MAKQPKFYVVWKGRQTGVFKTWDNCKAQTNGFDGAVFKSFESQAIAEKISTLRMPLRGGTTRQSRLAFEKPLLQITG